MHIHFEHVYSLKRHLIIGGEYMKSLKLIRNNRKYIISLVPMYYREPESLAIQMLCKIGSDWESYGFLTTNLDESLGRNCAYVDTNNMGMEILDWIMENNLGKPTGRKKQSGFFQYPEVRFNEEELKKFDNADYRHYLESCEGLNEGEVRLCTSCRICGKVYPVIVSQEQADMYEEYNQYGNHLIQDVFPDMPNEIRALFARGQKICGKCWKEMFGFSEDEDDIEEGMDEDNDSEE